MAKVARTLLGCIAMLAFLVSACGDKSSGSSSCTTNVQGCDAASFSCNAAQSCFTSRDGCEASGQCGGAGSGSTGCTTNVQGCDAEAPFSCDAAERCYFTLDRCEASGECGGGGGDPCCDPCGFEDFVFCRQTGECC